VLATGSIKIEALVGLDAGSPNTLLSTMVFYHPPESRGHGIISMGDIVGTHAWLWGD